MAYREGRTPRHRRLPGLCDAQRQYVSANPDASGGTKYAQKFKSTPGKKDGLYWPAAENEPASPFGPLVAEAHAEGYAKLRARARIRFMAIVSEF